MILRAKGKVCMSGSADIIGYLLMATRSEKGKELRAGSLGLR
jgi:hypothetical protein